MRKYFLLFAATLLALSVYAFRMLEEKSVSAFRQLGISDETVKTSIWYSISGGYLSYPPASKLRQIASGSHAATITSLLAHAKEYTQSQDFRQKYMEYREGRKPEPPTPPKSVAEQRRALRADLQKSLADAEKNLKSAPADQKEMFKGIVDVMREQIKSVDDPNNPMFSPEMEQAAKQGYEAEKTEHQTKLAEWEREFPVSPNPMIKAWLIKFLEATSDIDFNAKLMMGQNKKQVFANPEYESKPSNWKLGYRAGKETVTAGRAAAQQWLNELK